MFILKHLKMLQHVSIIIQTIFWELVCSLLKSLILKFVKNVESKCGDAAAMLLHHHIDIIRNRTRDLPACSVVPQLTAPPREAKSVFASDKPVSLQVVLL